MLEQADAALAGARRLSLMETRRWGPSAVFEKCGSEHAQVVAVRPDQLRIERRLSSGGTDLSTGLEWFRRESASASFHCTDIHAFPQTKLFPAFQPAILVESAHVLANLWLGGHSLSTLLDWGGGTSVYTGREVVEGTAFHRLEANHDNVRISLFLSATDPPLPVRYTVVWEEAPPFAEGQVGRFQIELRFRDLRLDPWVAKDAFSPPAGERNPPGAAGALPIYLRPPAKEPPPAGASIPAREMLATHRTQRDAMIVWMARFSRIQYERHGHRDPRWDQAMFDFLEVCERATDDGWPLAAAVGLRKDALHIQSLGCRDPLFLRACAVLTRRLGQFVDGRQVAGEIQDILKNSSYPASCRIAPLLWCLSTGSGKDGRSSSETRNELSTLFSQATAENDFSRGNQRFFIHWLGYVWDLMTRDERRLAVEHMATLADADPWLRAYYTGCYHLDSAMQGQDESPGGAEWRKHLAAAEVELSRAWELHPEFPEVPAKMVVLQGRVGEVRLARLWFDRAITGQPDHAEAYAALRACYVRHGKTDWVYELGLEAAGTERFDSYAPLQFWLCLIELARSGDNWQDIMARPGALATLRAVCDGYVAENDPRYPARLWHTAWLIGCWGAGAGEEAAAALRLLDSQPEVNVCWDAREHADALTMEALLLATPYASQGRMGLRLCAGGRFERGVPLLREAMLGLRETDPAVAAYLGDRITWVRFAQAPEVANIVLDTMMEMRYREIVALAYAEWRVSIPRAVPSAFRERVAAYLGPIRWHFLQEFPVGETLSNRQIGIWLDDLRRTKLNRIPGADTLPKEQAEALFASELALAGLRLHYGYTPEGTDPHAEARAYCGRYLPATLASIQHRGMLGDFMGAHQGIHQQSDHFQYHRDMRSAMRGFAHICGMKAWDHNVAEILPEVERLGQIADPDRREQEAWELFWRRGNSRVGFLIKQVLEESGSSVAAAIMEEHLRAYLNSLYVPALDHDSGSWLAEAYNSIPGYEYLTLGLVSKGPFRATIGARLAQADAALRLGDLNGAMAALIESRRLGANPNEWFFALGERFQGSDSCAAAIVQAISRHPNATEETRRLLAEIFPEFR